MLVRIGKSVTTLAVSAGLAGFCLASGVRAADLAPLDAYDGQTVSTAVYDWTGFYVGAHGGYGQASADSTNLGGFLGGVQLGYTVQSGQFVFGVEGDIGAAGVGSSRKSLDWLGSARARAGFAFNQYFVYGTGGFGFGKFSYSDGLSQDDRWNVGWVLGIGAEVALGRNWTARVEAFHYDLGRAGYNVASGPTAISLTGTVVRAGVNYRF